MNSFFEFVQKYNCKPCKEINKFSPVGKLFSADNEIYKGNYWFYETKDFIVDIHDFFIKKDYVMNKNDISPYVYLVSNYIITGNGEWFTPYQNIGPNTMVILKANIIDTKVILHENSIFLAVGVKFKEDFIKNKVIEKLEIEEENVSRIFWETRNNIIKDIRKIADEILNCKMTGVSAELFFEAKAREWLSITLNAYNKLFKEKNLNPSDKIAIENVANYINDHYALDISQKILEKIALMSGTNLKRKFKQRYKMNITEYKQRKRINIAENLILTTSIEIRNIAKAVGYNSASRFSTLFKRYKGVYPKDIKKSGKNYF